MANCSAPIDPLAEAAAAAAAALASGPSLATTFGAWLICASLGCMLFGLTTHQTYRYFRLYPSDKLHLKIMVAALLMFDVLHTIFNVHLCYYYLVTNYLNPVAMLSGVWSLRLSITVTACVMLISHVFFIHRIFLLGKRRWPPPVVIGALVVSEIALALAVTALTFIKGTFAAFASHMWLIWVLLANAVLIDIVITCCLSFYLYRSRTGFERTDSLLDVLIVYTINTGLSTSVLTLPAMICAVTMPNNLIWSSIYVIASKMYANSLLAVLNSRRSLVDRGMEGFVTGSFGLEVGESTGVEFKDAQLNRVAHRQHHPELRDNSDWDEDMEHYPKLTNRFGIKVVTESESFIDISAPVPAHTHTGSSRMQDRYYDSTSM